MAERYGRERSFGDRAADEVRSWVGDDEAQRRREMDEARERERERDRGERNWTDSSSRYRDYPRDRSIGRESGADRDYRYAGETALGRPDWGFGGEGSYEERQYMAEYDRPGWRNDRSYASRTGHSRPNYSRTDSSQSTYQGVNYSGMGPRGYRRSDQRILEDVCDRLTEDPRVNASDVEVKINDGVVTLSGTVQSREEKRAAEDCVESVAGVKDVSNNLRVSSGVIGTPGAPQTPLNLSSPGGESRQVVNSETEPTRRR